MDRRDKTRAKMDDTATIATQYAKHSKLEYSKCDSDHLENKGHKRPTKVISDKNDAHVF